MNLLTDLTPLKPSPALLAGVEEMLRQAAAKDQCIQAQEQQLQAQSAQLKCLELKNKALMLELAHLKRMRFGTKSEAFTAEQRTLFEEGAAQDIAAVQAELEKQAPKTPEQAPARKRERAGRQPLPPHLPRIEVRHEPESCTCGHCQGPLVKIGEDISEQLDIEPARFFVVRNIRPQYACRNCETVQAAPVSPAIIDGGMATPGLLTWVAIGKYLDHLPLYRLEQIAERQQVPLARSTLCEWIGRIGVALQPLADRLVEKLHAGSSLHADETPVQQLDPGSGKTKRAYLWAYRSNELAGDAPIVVFDYQLSRSGKHAATFLKDWCGLLMVDDYSGYKQLLGNTVVEQACLAHARRKFFELHADGGHPVAEEVLARIGELYAVEAQARGLKPRERYLLRQTKSLPILQALHDWLLSLRPNVATGSGLAKAIDYLLRRWEAFTRYAHSGDLPIDNNPVENSIRPITLGRRNWLFTGSERAGRRAAAIQSLLATAKLNGLDPSVWLRDTLEKLPTWPHSRIDELLPVRS